MEILDIHQGTEEVSCAVRKDGGDDPDATHGLLVYAAVCKKKESGVDIDGGRGVGRVTKKAWNSLWERLPSTRCRVP